MPVILSCKSNFHIILIKLILILGDKGGSEDISLLLEENKAFRMILL